MSVTVIYLGVFVYFNVIINWRSELTNVLIYQNNLPKMCRNDFL